MTEQEAKTLYDNLLKENNLTATPGLKLKADSVALFNGLDPKFRETVISCLEVEIKIMEQRTISSKMEPVKENGIEAPATEHPNE